MSVSDSPSPEISLGAQLAVRKVATIAVLAIGLGFLMQALILTITLAGQTRPGATILVGLAQGVTWSFLVCTGVGLGTTILKARPFLVGVIAFFCAPVALATAKASQKVMTGWLGAAEQQAILSLGAISVLRAVEYGILGYWLGRLVQKSEHRALRFMLAGASVGLVFGGGIAWLTYHAAIGNGAPLRTPALLATIVNEVVFPIGCALVIFLGQVVGRNLRVFQASSL